MVLALLFAACALPSTAWLQADPRLDAPPSLDLGLQPLDGADLEATLRLENTGSAPLSLSLDHDASADLALEASSLSLPPGESAEVVVRLANPGAVVLLDGSTLVVTSSDGDLRHAVALYGGAVADFDRDGAAHSLAGGADCDDRDPAIRPGVRDAHDGVDNDCDGVFDEDELDVGSLWITEWLALPSVPEAGFVELHNRSNERWRLDGWSLRHAGGAAPLDGVAVEAHERVVLCEDADQAASVGISCAVAVDPWPVLEADVGFLTLGPDFIEVDQVAWDAAWTAPPGVSLQVDGTLLQSANRNPRQNDSRAAWCVSVTSWSAGDLGSPGAENARCEAEDSGSPDSGSPDSGSPDSGATR